MCFRYWRFPKRDNSCLWLLTGGTLIIVLLKLLFLHRNSLQILSYITKTWDIELASEIDKISDQRHVCNATFSPGRIIGENLWNSQNSIQFLENKTHEWLKPMHYMTAVGAGRLGNEMFRFASLLGVASRYGYKPFIQPDNALTKVFDIPQVRKLRLTNTASFIEKNCCKYEIDFNFLRTDKNWTLAGYFQSWKYFRFSQYLVRRSFRFKDKILRKVEQYLQDMQVGNCTLVGVHVRREGINRGPGSIAGIDYINKSMNYFRQKYRGATFLVASDDKIWCHMNMYENDVIISPFEDAGIELALLAHCDHVIMTSGTFGWWGGWLAGGEVVFYNNFMTSQSWHRNQFDKEEYYPVTWIGME